MTTMQNSQPDTQAPQHDYAQLDRMLDKCKGRLFFKKGAGFLGSLLCNHKFIWDLSARTAWCNGETIAFNPDFFLKLPNETRVSVLAHELWHTGYDHMHRLGDRDPAIWNYAADYVINNMLDDWGFTFEGSNPLLDHAYDNMTTEQVYDLLIQEGMKPAQSVLDDLSEAGSGNEGAPSPNQGPGSGQPSPDLCGDVRVSDEVTEAEVAKKLVQAKQASQMAREAGVVPGEIELHIDKFLNPILPWEVLLYRYFTDLSNDDYSWRRPSRRHETEYLPSLMGENGLEHLIYYLDVSGSVSDHDILRFNSEVRYIHQELRPKRLTLVTFDRKIQDIYEFSVDDPFEEITVTGRGGTSLAPVYEHIKEHQPTAAVVFSDLFCTPMQSSPGVPVLWVIIGNPNVKTPFGTNIHMPPEP